MTNHKERYFAGQAECSDSIESLLYKEYDYIFLSSSWDCRCILLSDTNLKCQHAYLLLPAQTDGAGHRTNNDTLLREWLSKAADQPTELVSRDDCPLETWDHLYQLVLKSGRRGMGGGRALIDLSASCRFYSLGLVALLLRLGICSQIDLVYAECRYVWSNTEKSDFTIGQWQKMAIPFLDGNVSPGSPECSFISVGFEGLKTRRFLRSDEPDKIVLVLPRPGFNRDYEQRSDEVAESIVKEFGIDSTDVICAPAADAIAVWKYLTEWSSKSDAFEQMQISYICCGTKPHSLGLALHALASRKPVVFYIQADSLAVVPTEHTGTFWRYRVTDHSQLPR